MPVMEAGSPAHVAAVAELEAGLGPFDEPEWRSDLALLEGSRRSAAVQWAMDALAVRSLAARVPRSPGDDRGGTPWTSFVREVAVVRRLSDVAAHAEVALCLALVARHPRTLRLLLTGDVPAHRARVLVDACLGHPRHVVGAVEEQLAERLDTLTPTRIRQEVERTALRLDADTGARQEASATADRSVSRRSRPHGQGEIVLTGPAAVTQRWWDALTERARALKAAGDPRTLAALRFDVAMTADPRQGPGTDALLTACGAGRPEDDGPSGAPSTGFAPALTDDARRLRPVQASIAVPAAAALGLSDEPGWLEGHGWISAPLCRRLLAVAELRQACVSPETGQLVDHSDRAVRPGLSPRHLREAVRSMVVTAHELRALVTDDQPQHDPTRALKSFLQARDRYCDGPTGTLVPSARTDLDHEQPWPAGPTAAHNLVSRSGRTHHLKHLGWRPVRSREGTVWTSPAGQTVLAPHHHHRPPPVPPGSRPPDPDELAAADLELTRPPTWDDDVPF